LYDFVGLFLIQIFPMAEKMTETQVIAEIAERTNLPKATVKKVFSAFADLVVEKAKAGVEVSLPKLGRFYIGKTPARTIKHPKTGQEYKVPSKKVIKFRVKPAIREV
jgi:DNA-binding protein HU-beta